MISQEILKTEILFKIKQIQPNFIYSNESINKLRFIYEGLCAGMSKNQCIDLYKTRMSMNILSKALNNSTDSFKLIIDIIDRYNYSMKKLLWSQFENWLCNLSIFKKMKGE